ncbi:hypothetical protein ACET3Z_000469 [Daucus carota]
MSDELGFLVAFTKASRSLLFVRIINRLLSQDARPKSWFASYKFLYSSRTCAGRVKESPIPMPQGRETGVIPRPPSIGARFSAPVIQTGCQEMQESLSMDYRNMFRLEFNCDGLKLLHVNYKPDRNRSKQGEVEPYIPFNINPSGMQPILTTTYLLAVPSILAGLLGSPVWEYIKQMLNPETSTGAGPWVYYTIYSFFVFVFNIFDIVRGLLLATLATTSSILDHYLRSINLGFSISFTSVLIIVGSIIELRRSYQAYNVMPSLSKALKRYGV